MNQNPEQLAQDCIYDRTTDAGCSFQGKKSFNLALGIGIAIHKCQTDAGFDDHDFFIDMKLGLLKPHKKNGLV